MKQLSGVPRKIRSDDGTENCVIEALCTFLGPSHADENAVPGSFNIGRSTANQRIESYQSQFVKDGPGWWINFFKDLSDLGLFKSTDPVHQECFRFRFMQILRNELKEVAEMWNQHIIASSKFENSSGPRGRPDCMFFLPHLYNSENYKVPVDPQELEEFIDKSTMCLADWSQEFEEFAIKMTALGLQPPQNVNEALDMYVTLIKEVERLP